MKMHQTDVSPWFSVPSDGRTCRASSPTRTYDTDPSVCEWAVDLSDRATVVPDTDSPASLTKAGFVDFDAIETVHVSGASATRS